MHRWDEATDLLATSVIGYAVERLKTAKDTTWGARPADELAAALDGTISHDGVGGHAALALFRDVLMHACRPMDSPLHLAYVATAPTPAANLFDLVVSASSIFGGLWEGGAGAIAAENEALAWLAGLAGFPHDAGGCFVSGGSAANLSALVTARHRAREHGDPSARRWRFATTAETHASVHAAARVMDVDVVLVPPDERGRMTGAALRATLDAGGQRRRVRRRRQPRHDERRRRRRARGDRRRVRRSRPVAPHRRGVRRRRAVRTLDGLAAAWHRARRQLRRRPAQVAVRALRLRRPRLPRSGAAAAAHAQHGTYLDMVSRDEWNPSDFAFHLSRRARGLPLWFSLATYGTDAYAEAVETTLAVTRAFAAEVERRDGFSLLLQPQLSVVLFTVDALGRRPLRRVDRRHEPAPASPSSCRRGGTARSATGSAWSTR